MLARSPDLPDAWYNLAVLQRNAGRFDAALASYRQALDRGIARPEEVHLNRGVIFSDFLRRDDAAEAELRAALALNPQYVPALLNLANLKADLGQRDEALALCERVLTLDPDSSDGLARYADVKQVTGPDDPLIGNLKRALVRAYRRRRTRLISASRSARCSIPAVPTIRRSTPMRRRMGTAGKAPRPRVVLYDRRRQEPSSIS